MIKEIILGKVLKKGFSIGKKAVKKIDEKTQISAKVKAHSKEITGVAILFGTGLTVGFLLGRKTRKKSIFDRIAQKRKKMKRKKQMKMLKESVKFIIKLAAKKDK